MIFNLREKETLNLALEFMALMQAVPPTAAVSHLHTGTRILRTILAALCRFARCGITTSIRKKNYSASVTRCTSFSSLMSWSMIAWIPPRSKTCPCT